MSNKDNKTALWGKPFASVIGHDISFQYLNAWRYMKDMTRFYIGVGRVGTVISIYLGLFVINITKK